MRGRGGAALPGRRPATRPWYDFGPIVRSSMGATERSAGVVDERLPPASLLRRADPRTDRSDVGRITLVGNHHEHTGRQGYFRGLGAGIPLGARIICVANRLDELTHDQPGRPAHELSGALQPDQRRGRPKLTRILRVLIGGIRPATAARAQVLRSLPA